MKAAFFSQHGDPAQVLTLGDVPVPTPRRGEVLVRMLASPINPSDLMYIAGKYTLQPKAFPCVPGFEGVGVVEASGGGLLGMLRKGKRVALLNDTHGNWCEKTVTKARQVIPIPDGIPDDQAAGFFVNPLTAIAMTADVLRVPGGAWLLQSAAGSALGQMVIRLGQLSGFRTINVVRRAEQVDELKKLGADVVLVESDGPIAEQVKKATDGVGVKYAIDPVGGATGLGMMDSLSVGGTCLIYGSLSGEAMRIDPRQLISGSKTVKGFWLSDWVKRQRIMKMLIYIRHVKKLLATGMFRTAVAKTYKLDDVQQAVAHAAGDARGGKVLLSMS
jgi:NADPH:quinone reductase